MFHKLALAALLAAAGGEGSDQLHQAMAKSAQQMQSMQMMGDVDHDFVMSMQKHHQDALDMANIELKYGKDEQAKAFARKTIEMQKKDIAEFKQWLSKHGMAK